MLKTPTGNPLTEMKNELAALLHNAKEHGWIDGKEFSFLLCEHPRIPAFYMLPKIHKEPKDNPLGRPIVAANGSLTEPAAQFIDYFLKPYEEFRCKTP